MAWRQLGKQNESVMGYNPSRFKGDNNPVENVSWYDAVEFCNLLSDREGMQRVYTITNRVPSSGYPITEATVTMDRKMNGYRLPTEAEWEYAARGGDGSPGNYEYDGAVLGYDPHDARRELGRYCLVPAVRQSERKFSVGQEHQVWFPAHSLRVLTGQKAVPGKGINVTADFVLKSGLVSTLRPDSSDRRFRLFLDRATAVPMS